MNSADNKLVDALFEWMATCWQDLKPALLEQKLTAIQDINARNPFPNNVSIVIIPDSVNMCKIDAFKGIVEMYFSATMNDKNIPYVETLYKKYLAYRSRLPDLVACKYYPFTKEMSTVEQLRVGDETISVELFRAHTILGYEQKQSNAPEDSKGNMLVNLVIVFDASLEKYFEKNKIWIPRQTNKKDFIGEFLVNLVGEFNFLHRTATIRLLSSGDDDAILEHSKHPYELRTVYDELERMHYRDTKRCIHCGHADYQVSLMRCSACKVGMYCSKVCQKAHRPLHKANCKSAIC